MAICWLSMISFCSNQILKNFSMFRWFLIVLLSLLNHICILLCLHICFSILFYHLLVLLLIIFFIIPLFFIRLFFSTFFFIFILLIFVFFILFVLFIYFLFILLFFSFLFFQVEAKSLRVNSNKKLLFFRLLNYLSTSHNFFWLFQFFLALPLLLLNK